jgi:hypothetical protein
LIHAPMHQINESPAVRAGAAQAPLLRGLRRPTQQTGLHRPAHGLRLDPFVRCIQVFGVMWLALTLGLPQSKVGGQSSLPCLALEAVRLGQVGRQESV